MTLLGVGGGAGSLAGNTTTLGRIGSGYMYADWKSQIAYTSPNWNGFSFTAGVTQGFDADTSAIGATNPDNPNAFSGSRSGSQSAYEGKASYAWTGDFAGKVWASAISQKVENLTALVGTTDERATAYDIGTTVNVAGFGLTGYYGQGKGIGQTLQLLNGFDANGKRRDSDQWYVQGTYTLPGVGTKLGVSYGESTLDGNGRDTFSEIQDSMITVGAYHPLTKHLNIVAEYSESERELDRRVGTTLDAKAKTISLGAILFF